MAYININKIEESKVTDLEINDTQLQGRPDPLVGSALENQIIFDSLPKKGIEKHNNLIQGLLLVLGEQDEFNRVLKTFKEQISTHAQDMQQFKTDTQAAIQNFNNYVSQHANDFPGTTRSWLVDLATHFIGESVLPGKIASESDILGLKAYTDDKISTDIEIAIEQLGNSLTTTFNNKLLEQKNELNQNIATLDAKINTNLNAIGELTSRVQLNEDKIENLNVKYITFKQSILERVEAIEAQINQINPENLQNQLTQINNSINALNQAVAKRNVRTDVLENKKYHVNTFPMVQIGSNWKVIFQDVVFTGQITAKTIILADVKSDGCELLEVTCGHTNQSIAFIFNKKPTDDIKVKTLVAITPIET